MYSGILSTQLGRKRGFTLGSPPVHHRTHNTRPHPGEPSQPPAGPARVIPICGRHRRAWGRPAQALGEEANATQREREATVWRRRQNRLKCGGSGEIRQLEPNTGWISEPEAIF